MNPNLKNPKIPKVFCCEYCHFSTSNKKDYSRHLSTDKHLDLTNTNKKPIKTSFVCICGKSYKHSSSLCLHKKTCLGNKDDSEKFEIYDLVKFLMKENNELKNVLLEQNNKMIEHQNIMMKVLENGTNNTTTTHTNSHNKAFNLNLFLNETCKDAMNIMDFVESIKLQVTDLERIGEVGYVEGISDIIVSNLNKLDITQRPIHCTDKKRETMYVKDAGKWEKDENTNLIRRAIRKVTHNNQRLLPQFKEKYPDYHNSYSSHSDKVTKVVIETMVNNVPDKEEKIIRNIAKSVVLDKAHSL